MKPNPLLICIGIAISALLVLQSNPARATPSTAITYQGQLTYQGSPFNGTIDFRFSLYDALTNGNQIGSTITNTGVAITNGLFTVTLDFGDSVFNGDSRFLGIAVGNDSEMTPRQTLTPAPYAIRAREADSSSGSVDDTQLSPNIPRLDGNQSFTGSNIFSGINLFPNGSNIFTGIFIGDGSSVSNLNASGISSGTVNDARLSTNVAKLGSDQTFTGSNIFSGVSVFGNGPNVFTGVFNGDASSLSNISASAISSGTVDDARLSGNVAKLGADQTFIGSNVFTGTVKSISGGTEFFMVPRGAILLWWGSEGSIPAGWALCNGANGTPDLRNRFVVGAGTGSAYTVAATGGATNHTHDTAIGTPTTSSAGAHTHTTVTGTTGSESAHTHSINPPSTTSGSAGSHTHGGGTLQFGRGVDVVGSGSGGGFSINLSSGAGASFLSPTIGWGGATASGGSHTHSVDIASFTSAAGSAHSHSIPALTTDSQGAHTHTVSIGTVTSTSGDSRPPYYALCYIMKL